MLHLDTPLLESLPLGELAGRRIYLKMDALQPTGSFKIRGIGYACEYYRAGGAQRFLASSGGNAGLAVAYAGRKLGVPVEIVVPEATKPGARRAILNEGAVLHVHGASWNEAHAFALGMLRPEDRYIHPFDDALLWEGHATLVDEVVAAGVKPDAVVLSVGGGGLLCGVVAGLQRHGLHHATVYAVEPDGADSYAQALLAGKPVEIPRSTTLAVSLSARKVTAHVGRTRKITSGQERPYDRCISDNRRPSLSPRSPYLSGARLFCGVGAHLRASNRFRRCCKRC